MKKTVYKKIKNKVFEYKYPIISSWVVGLLTYMFFITNKLPNHDDTCTLFAKGATLDSGRWGLSLMSYIFPNFSMPWFYGIISIAIFCIAICVILHTLQIKSKLSQIIVSGIVISFPSLIGTFTYAFTVSSFAVSFLMAALSVMFINEKRVYKNAIAVVLMVLSLGIYQSYISLAASLLIVLAIKSILDKNSEPTKIILLGLKYIAFLIASLAIYYVITQLCLVLSNTSFGEYANENLSLENEPILLRLKMAYKAFLEEIFAGKFGLIPTLFERVLNTACILILATEAVIWLFEKNNIVKKLLMIVSFILLPLSINCMYLFVNEEAIHSLVMYGFVSVYFLVIVFIENVDFENKRYKAKLKCVVPSILSVAMCGIVISNVYVGYQVYLKMLISYENTYSFYTSMVAQVKSTPGFEPDTKLAIIGYTDSLVYSKYEFDDFDISGIYMSPNMYSRERFIKYYIGFDIDFATEEEISEIIDTKEFKKMTYYPYYGSIQKIGNNIVVKLSEKEK